MGILQHNAQVIQMARKENYQIQRSEGREFPPTSASSSYMDEDDIARSASIEVTFPKLSTALTHELCSRSIGSK